MQPQPSVTELSDRQLLAHVICHRLSPALAEDLAARLLERFGSLYAVVNAPEASFCEIHGLGPSRYFLLQSMLELHKRTLQQAVRNGQTLRSVEQTASFLATHLQHYRSECFAVILLNSQHQFLAFKELFKGTINSAPVFPREIVYHAMQHNAANVILAHNHPSGNPEPSEADKLITKRIQEALALIDVKVLDHFVVGAGATFSFAQRGWI
jgi:DNA repair protein RadC